MAAGFGLALAGVALPGTEPMILASTVVLGLAAAMAVRLPVAASAALVGASRPEQVQDNVKAAGVTLDADLMATIDEVLGDVVESDAGKTAEHAPSTRVA